MPRLLAAALSVPTVVLTAATIVGAIRHPSGPTEDMVGVAISACTGLAFLLVGLLVLGNMPRHVIGWILVALGLDVSVMIFTGQLRSDPVTAEAGEIISGATWAVAIPLVAILMLVFPTGRPISSRWRWAVWSAAVWPPVVLALNVASPVSMRDGRLVTNANGLGGPPGDFLAFLLPVLFWAIAPLVLVAGAAVVVRFRQARGDERQQLKWVAFAGAGIGVVAILSFTPVWGGWLALLDDVSILALPVAIAIAILRHRLYDIDVIIRRTLVYGTLTVLLGTIYAGGVVLLTQLLGAFANGNQFAVAVSTIAVVVLFQPLRRRVKASVDRRFYRSRFDARRIVEALGAQLRTEVDLDSLTAALSGAVTQTMQPTSTSVWLRWRPGGAR
jgi:hypothetical protein